MKQEKVLGILILSELVLGVLAAISYFALEPILPAPLRAYLATDGAARFRLYDTLLLALWVAVVVTTILAWIGLLFLLRPARPIYLASWAGYLVLLLLRGAVVSTSVSFVIEMMTAIVGGGILGLIYFSELGAKFRHLSEVIGAAEENTA